MKIYLVGGAVRDDLLGLPVSERDWVVVGATEDAMLAAGYRRADADFPVFIHPESGEEYALARTETKTGPGYKGFETYAGSDVTLEQDLLRRDLTINALAMDADGELIDVCGGREDLDEGLLRHVTNAFVEDPVRLLRVARFAAKLGRWGFRLAHGTQGLLKKMATGDELRALTSERLQKEMWKAMAEDQPWRFFEVLQRCGALQVLLPELSRLMGEREAHRAAAKSDAMAALKRVVKLSDDPGVRFVVAMFDAVRQAADSEGCIAGLRTGRPVHQLFRDMLELAPMVASGAGLEALLRFVRRLKTATQPQRFETLVPAAQALWTTQVECFIRELRVAREVVESTDATALRAQGLTGAELGTALEKRQLEQLHERLNELSC